MALASLLLIAGPAGAEDGTGTLRGVVTIVGDDAITDGEVVVSHAGTNTSAGTATFSSADPSYEVQLAPGGYTVYAWAKVHHNSLRVPLTITANGTTWVNLTVVRIEEVMGTVRDPEGVAVPGAVMQFTVSGTIVGTSISDDRGQFRDLLGPGTYRLKVTKAGYRSLDRNVTVEPGQVLTLDLVMEPVPGVEEEEPFPWLPLLVGLFIFATLGLSLGYVVRQGRKVRQAAARTEAERTVDMECPGCGARVSGGSLRCPECSHVFQVRCDECGRAMDAGTPECPECGAPIG